MNKIMRRIEKLTLSLESFLGIRYPHTVLIIFLFLIIMVLVASIIFDQIYPTHTIKAYLFELLRFVFAVIFTGVILGIVSNRVYDQIKVMSNDPIRRAMSESGMIGFFLPDSETEKHRRTELTSERVNKMEGQVCLLGIAATSYLPKRDDTSGFSNLFIKKLLSRKIQLRLVLLNPYSKAAKFRYAREENIDVDSLSANEKDQYERSALHNDVVNTLDKVKELKNRGALIDCRVTNFEPTISLMLNDDFVYIDILSLGRYEESTKVTKQRSTLPILEFSPRSPYYKVAKSHFEYHWKYGITPDELDFYKLALQDEFFKPSFTGYRLIKQHDSWISIDPVVGCNAGCRYCVLRTTFQNNTAPTLYTDPEVIGDRLRESKFYSEDAIFCLFNYTDALLGKNKDYLVQCLKVLKKRLFQNWVCIPTKQPVDDAFFDAISVPQQNLWVNLGVGRSPRV